MRIEWNEVPTHVTFFYSKLCDCSWFNFPHDPGLLPYPLSYLPRKAYPRVAMTQQSNRNVISPRRLEKTKVISLHFCLIFEHLKSAKSDEHPSVPRLLGSQLTQYDYD